MNKIEYTWAVSENTEIWRHDVFDTVEDCVQDYLENYAGEDLEESIFVGEVKPFEISVDSYRILETLSEEAYEECGDVAENWLYFRDIEKDTEELNEKLTQVVIDWLKKHDYMPSFYKITDIRGVEVR
ncbi:MAG TPA: hypothetical protein DIC60_01140 [Lachnospiraceae bacterium]|nr:hypothetical protein [Lachnospiraceae bacterium]